MSESTNYNSTVHSFYLAFFGRPADPAGLKFWSEHLATVNGDLAIIAESFAGSEEARVRFGDDTPAERIAEIYQQLFNRAPEAGGLAFWTAAVEQSHVSLADVAISILEGAQGTDADLATLREQAVADFTAQVEASGTDYDGYAAVEAARVLVRAVTPDASPEDIAEAVKAAVAFTDIASTNPTVVGAIATGSSLLALFDTKRGLQDPVTLLQALADVAEAAAGSPATLESLLRGGGMAKVLDVMPARASLQDVVDALAEGGLPAAIDVVYPPRPTTPAPSTGVSFKFESVDQGLDDRVPNDNVTNLDVVDVTFSFTGSLRTGEKFQYSVDGGESWHPLEAVGKTLTIAHLDLWNGSEGGHDKRGVSIMDAGAELTTEVQVRVADASDKTVKSISQDIVFDNLRPYGELNFVRIDDGAEGDLATGNDSVDATFSITGFDEEVFVQWRLKGEEKWADIKVDGKGGFTLQDIDLSEDDQTVEVRVIDAAGNVGSHDEWTIDGPVGAQLEILPSVNGLLLTSPVSGTLHLGNTPVLTTEQGKAVVANVETTIGEQLAVVEGTLTVTPTAGLVLSDPDDTIYTLGTALGETLNGHNLWGFGGNDTLTGSAGDDILIGGDGDDTIHSKGGTDTILGGAGADMIFLEVDGEGARLGFEAGDTLTGQFKNGDAFAGMDRIIGAEAGDQFFFDDLFYSSTPTVSDDFLTNADSGQMSMVRGTLSSGHFWSASDGSSYVMQWTDGTNINSVLVAGYDGNGLALKFDSHSPFVTLAKPPVMSTHSTTEYRFGAETTRFILNGSPGNVAPADSPTGLLSTAGLVLTDLLTDTIVTDIYTGGVDFGVQADGSLRLGSALKAGVYTMSWDAHTFVTEDGAYAAGQQRFAGGADGQIVQQGFEFKTEKVLTGGLSSSLNDSARVLYHAGDTANTIITGTSTDIVLADTGKVTLQYHRLNSKAQDLVVGFGEDDQIQFAGTAMPTINRNGGMTIDWAHGTDSDGRVVATHAHEGAFIETAGLIASDELLTAGSDTLATLNAHLDISALEQDEGLLILAHDQGGSGGALLYFVDLDNNGEIDADEVELVAMFADGVPDMEQVILVGFG